VRESRKTQCEPEDRVDVSPHHRVVTPWTHTSHREGSLSDHMGCFRSGLIERRGAMDPEPRSATRILLVTLTMAVMVSVGALSASATALAEPLYTPNAAASTQHSTKAICSYMADVYGSPGGTLVSSSTTFSTRDESGRITCIGTLKGRRMTGPGSFGTDGTATGSCVALHVSGEYFFTVPTDDGPMHFTTTYIDNTIRLTGVVHGTDPRFHLAGAETFVPIHGDCVTTPLTQAHSITTFIVTDRDDAPHIRL
jgi:hypothetical protein